MPLYEYECFVCHDRFERIQKTTADPIKICPGCGGAVRRLLGAPALQFKGSGWYVTDYGKGSSTKSSSEAAGSEKSTPSSPPKAKPSSTSEASKG